jgi:hypothetical protein
MFFLSSETHRTDADPSKKVTKLLNEYLLFQKFEEESLNYYSNFLPDEK